MIHLIISFFYEQRKRVSYYYTKNIYWIFILLFPIKCNLQLILFIFLIFLFRYKHYFPVHCMYYLIASLPRYSLLTTLPLRFLVYIYIYIYIYCIYREEATMYLQMQINFVCHSIRQINFNLLIRGVSSTDLLIRMLKFL